MTDIFIDFRLMFVISTNVAKPYLLLGHHLNGSQALRVLVPINN
jgi:hypothetical protein